jgi:hypothetical protein
VRTDEVAARALFFVELDPCTASDFSRSEGVIFFLSAVTNDDLVRGSVISEFLHPCLKLRIGDFFKAAAAHVASPMLFNV